MGIYNHRRWNLRRSVFLLQSVWGDAIVLIDIYTGLFGTLLALFFVHSRQRDNEREKRLQYWREQVGHY